MGFKCLRDGKQGVDSANLVAMFNMDYTNQSWNFFANTLSTVIGRASNPDLFPLERKFASATTYMQSIGLHNWGMWN